MSLTVRFTIAFYVMCMFWYIIVVAFAMDDIAIERALSPGRANLPSEGGITVNDSTAGEFSVGSVKDISFIRRLWITVTVGMPWWFNLFIGLFNGFLLFLLTIMWILKIVHGNG